MTRNTAILIFDEVEVLDFCGPFEVFGVAGRGMPEKPFNVYTVAPKAGPVSADRPFALAAAISDDGAPVCDRLAMNGDRSRSQTGASAP